VNYPPAQPADVERSFRPGTVNYTAAQTANAEQGMLQLSTIHQRVGGTYRLDNESPQGWLRLYGDNQNNEEDRFGYNQHLKAIQAGHDLVVQRDGQGNISRAGVIVDYAHGETTFSDRDRWLFGLGSDTGKMDSDSIGLGGYYTRLQTDGSYLDVVGMMSHLRNSFGDSYGDNSVQDGWRAGLSAEVGKPVASINEWKVEPQAQLAYQHTRYSDFHDDTSQIDGYSADNLRGRLGVRLSREATVEKQPAEFYGITNVIGDFLGSEAVKNDDTSVDASFDKIYAEIGVGGRVNLAKNTVFYSDVRYRRSLEGGGEGSQLNLGFKFDF
jgi:autotransporter family porin